MESKKCGLTSLYLLRPIPHIMWKNATKKHDDRGWPLSSDCCFVFTLSFWREIHPNTKINLGDERYMARGSDSIHRIVKTRGTPVVKATLKFKGALTVFTVRQDGTPCLQIDDGSEAFSLMIGQIKHNTSCDTVIHVGVIAVKSRHGHNTKKGFNFNAIRSHVWPRTLL